MLAGVSLSIGLLPLLVGLYIKTLKIYLYFGIFSIGAGLYYLIFNLVEPSSTTFLLNNRLLISSAALYYLIFPWFIAEFTRSRQKVWQVLLSSTILAGYLVFLLSDIQNRSLTWHVIIHAGSIGIGLFGMFRGDRKSVV